MHPLAPALRLPYLPLSRSTLSIKLLLFIMCFGRLCSVTAGPDMFKGQSGGSHGIFDGRFAGYWNTGKGSTWEGGVRETAFAYWKGTIPPGGRSAEVVSSLDVFPTFSALARLPLPAGVVYDGRDMSDVLLTDGGRSRHDVVFIYSQDPPPDRGPAAARMGRWKAHWSRSH